MREFELLKHVFRFNTKLPSQVIVPPGDDMAAVDFSYDGAQTNGDKVDAVLTLAVEVRIAEHTTNHADAWRMFGSSCFVPAPDCVPSAALALSSLQKCSVVAVVLARTMTESDALALHEGLRDQSQRIGAPIVGGDIAVAGETSSSQPTVICATVMTLAQGVNDGQRSAPRTALIACDTAIEGRHTPHGCDPYLIGKKAVLRNLSDVAAMGNAIALATVAGIVVPRGLDADRLARLEARLEAGLRETAERWGAPLQIIARAEYGDGRGSTGPIIASVTIVGAKLDETRPFALRGDARVGDGVYVTGTIGGAWDEATGLGRHLDFTPRLAVAHGLVASLGDRLGAMIDVSDGLGRDLGHIAALSKVGIEIDLARVPVTAGCAPRAAIAHGEDYELAFTARGAVPASIAGVSITRIGIVVDGSPRVMVRDGTQLFDASRLGFEHDGKGANA